MTTTYTMSTAPSSAGTVNRRAVVVGRRQISTNSQTAIVQVPADQMYYWTRAWQANERLASAELACGEGREFDDVNDALRWLRDEA